MKTDFFDKFQEMKEVYDIPSLVFVRRSDMKILIDTNYEPDLEILWDIYKSDNPLEVYIEDNSVESLSSSTIDSYGNHYLSEFVFNFVATKVNPKKVTYLAPYRCREELKLNRKDNWIHFNIYLPYEHQDDFLGIHLNDRLQKITNNGAINKFFFIRYFDERHHIRLRVDPSSQNDIYLLDKYLTEGVMKGDIIDYSLGKYEPEYERYGGLSVISQAEDFFFADSLLILNLLNSSLFNDKIDKIDHAIFLNFKLLNSYSEEMNEQYKVMNAGYSNRQFSVNYRENRKKYLFYNELAATPCHERDSSNYFAFNEKHLGFWKDKLDSYLDKLKKLDQSDVNIIRSLIHMTCIRIFGIKSEEEELVGNMVWRVLKQKIAMAKYNN